MKRSLFAITAVLLALACAPEKEHPAQQAATDTADENAPQEGGTLLRRLETDVATLNPVLATSRYDRLVDNYLFTPLVYIDANLQPISGLAEKWEISPDGKLYTFHLSPKATFSDGTPVRASDVLFTLRKLVDPKTEAPQIAGGFEQLDLAATHVVDDHTIVVGFKEVFASQMSRFNELLTVPEHVYATGDFRNDFVSRAIGSGPYRLARRVAGKEILLERREDYWSKKPYIKNVLFKVVVDNATAWNALQRGDLDETTVSSDIWLNESNNLQLKDRLEFRRFYTLSYNYIPWNGRDPIVGDKRVRRALSMCVDLKSLINNLYHGTARAMSGPFTPDSWAYNPEVPVVEFNPGEARHILNSLGWLDTDNDGLLDKGKKPLQIEMLVIAGSGPTLTFAQLFQAELKKIGVQLNILPLDPSVLIQRVLAGSYQSAYLGWDQDPDPDPFNIFHSSQMPPHGQNFIYYSNPQADRLIEAGRRELDRNKRQAIYRELHALLADDQPYTWTIQVSSKWACTSRVRGVRESNGYGLFLWYPGEFDWWIAPTPARRTSAPR
ncbi:MAG TPA: ABC transporter substrate-binding protein [Thermoanaerobaculia bacterium]|nr:ABC transporter substrate-binding protein [Thermoanaerobaculia bacterium]